VKEVNGLPEDSDLKAQSQPYKLRFGKHKGLPLGEVPPGYIHWLVWNGIHFRYNDLKAALNEHRQVQTARARGLSQAQIFTNRITMPRFCSKFAGKWLSKKIFHE